MLLLLGAFVQESVSGQAGGTARRRNVVWAISPQTYEVGQSAGRISTPHLDVTIIASEAKGGPGRRFTIGVEVAPKRGMHVYAPGAANYRSVALSIHPQRYVRVVAEPFPRSETFYFAPLDERVPAYEKPFKLTAEVAPEATAEARKALSGRTELVLMGSLAYQACDDKLCYNPTSIPLSWRVALTATPPGTPAPRAR